MLIIPFDRGRGGGRFLDEYRATGIQRREIPRHAIRFFSLVEVRGVGKSFFSFFTPAMIRLHSP